VDEVGGGVLVHALVGTEDRADFEIGPVTAGSNAHPRGLSVLIFLNLNSMRLKYKTNFSLLKEK
jgi:hypothetical protein